MNFLATRRPRLDLDARLKRPRNPDVVVMLACGAFLVVWSAIAIYWEFVR